MISGSKPYHEIETAILSSPFLADKKLVIIDNFIKQSSNEAKEKIHHLLERLPSDTEIIFREDQKPDQRLSITKLFNKIAKSQNFETLKQNDIVLWIEKRVQELGGSISKQDSFFLFQKIGSDLQELENEIIKLITHNKAISKTTIENLVDPGFFNTIFELMDHISNKNNKEAQKIMLRTLENEEGNELYILSMLSRQIRNLQIIKDLSDHKLNEQEIVSKTKLHPFVVKKTLIQTRNFSTDELIGYQKRILEAEIKIKTTGTSPSLLVLNLTNKLSSK
jgi:DNA polymerase-3 subunit delta